MRWLIGNRGQERGAVAVIVAVVVGTLVLTGVAALTIDAGNLYAERRVVQNGADAASLALAQACAEANTDKCRPDWPELKNLADLNSSDGLTDIDSVCGNTAPFAACVAPADPLTLVECTKLPTLPSTVRWVEVRTKTRSTGSNPSVVAKSFANISDPSYKGKGVRACSRAAWGPPSSIVSAMPVTISKCEFDMYTAGGLLASGPYAPTPLTYPLPTTGPTAFAYEKAIKFHDGTGGSAPLSCPQGPSGADAPGGFGYLENTGCNATSSATGIVPRKPGNPNNTALGCQFVDHLSATTGKPIYLPIYKEVVGTDYVMDGVAAFWLTGYSTSGNRHASDASGRLNTLCTPSQTCLFGWFVSDLITSGSFGTGTGTARGAYLVAVAG